MYLEMTVIIQNKHSTSPLLCSQTNQTCNDNVITESQTYLFNTYRALYFWKILVSIDVVAVKKVLNKEAICKASYRTTNKIDNLKV